MLHVKVTFITVIVILLFIWFFVEIKTLIYKKRVYSLYDRFQYKLETHNRTYSTLEGVVDNVYCISMPKRKDYITNKMKQLGTSYTLMNAITPNDLTYEDYEQLSDTYNPRNKLMYKKMTKLPLQVSFTVCMLDAIKNNYETIIIFEDDISIEKDIETIKKGIEEFKFSNYDLFYMGYCTSACKYWLRDEEYTELVEVDNESNINCTHATVYKKSVLPNVLDTIYPMDMYYDNLLAHVPNKCVPTSVYFDQDRKNMGSLNEDLEPNKKLPTCSFRTPPGLQKL